jgi:transcriptional regulator with XRE-family HTH domain
MANESLNEIARRVKEGRIQKNYTQQELASMAGISLRSIQRIENAEVLPRAYTLKALGGHLDIPLERQKVFNKADGNRLTLAQKIILSVSAVILIFLLAGAYIFQSPTFPETAFEAFLYIATFVCIYMVIMLAIWG